MNRLAICIICAGLSAPALAQDLNPALEGTGQQTQSLDLVGGAVSVSVESGGSLSLNRGDDALGGSLSVTVNDVSVGVGSPRENGDASAATGTPPSNGSGNLPTVGPQPTAAGFNAANMPSPNNTDTSGRLDCRAGSITARELSDALAEGLPVMTRPAPCTDGTGEAASLLVAAPSLASALSQAGIPDTRVVSITISSNTVIVDYAPPS